MREVQLHYACLSVACLSVKSQQQLHYSPAIIQQQLYYSPAIIQQQLHYSTAQYLFVLMFILMSFLQVWQDQEHQLGLYIQAIETTTLRLFENA